MKLARNIEIRVFCKEGESQDTIEQGLRSLFPFNLEDQKIAVDKRNSTGFENKNILIYKVRLEKERHCNIFLKKFFAKLDSGQKHMLLDQLDSRIDDELSFYIRLDKQKLLDSQQLRITELGNCFHIRIGIAAYPSTKMAAKDIAVRIINIAEKHD